ncbi:hypothetical protein RclHR1_05050012 [Rhizophagus clarus]|uniref:Uncharacterized protein n=1 Tax=Rhizophagus clarus TaxID=94130 RepID=A0A2Z6SDM7_9GLOM|nr:hypothetical protein RclHR1_05050012 [Rhizophagus clarus]
MAGIATRYVTENELNNEMSIEELSRHAPALGILLMDKTKRDQTRRRFKKGYNFSEKQVFALISKQTAGQKKEGAVSNTPDTTQKVEPEEGTVNVKKDVEVIAKALSGTASNASAGLSRLTRLQRELKAFRASKKIISATFIPDITYSANKIQKENRLLRENEGIYYPDHFSLESVKERLDSYVVSNIPDKQALADVMIMLCIRPGEIKDLHIFNENVTGYGKNRDQQDIPRVFRSLEKNEEWAKQLLIWIQEAIFSRQLRDPGKPGVLWFNTFLKKDEFLPEIGKPLLPSSLRKLGAVFAVVSHGSKNLSEAMTIASEALRHSADNHVSPAKNYTIVNYRPRRVSYDRAKAFEFFDEN